MRIWTKHLQDSLQNECGRATLTSCLNIKFQPSVLKWPSVIEIEVVVNPSIQVSLLAIANDQASGQHKLTLVVSSAQRHGHHFYRDDFSIGIMEKQSINLVSNALQEATKMTTTSHV